MLNFIETIPESPKLQGKSQKEIHEEMVDLHKVGTPPSITGVRSLKVAIQSEGGSALVHFMEADPSLPPPNSLIPVPRKIPPKINPTPIKSPQVSLKEFFKNKIIIFSLEIAQNLELEIQ